MAPSESPLPAPPTSAPRPAEPADRSAPEEPESPGTPPGRAPDDGGALDSFLAEHVTPRRGLMNRWTAVSTHRELLQDAARRRGMTAERITDNHVVFSLSGIVVGGMDSAVTSLVSNHARRVARSKQLTRRYLETAGVPTPQGRGISPTQFSRAVKYLKTLGGPAAVKPSTGRTGRGVTADVRTEPELRHAWLQAMHARSATSGSQYQMVVEAHHPGLDLRCFVVGRRVAAAIVRVPLHVVGDGSSTVGELAAAEISRRRGCAALSSRQPQITEAFLEPVGLSPDTVIPAGETAQLTPIADLAAGGGIAVDVTDALSEDLTKLAADGLAAVPGLETAVVDLLAPRLDTGEDAVVLDINPYASIIPFRYPAYGTARPVDAEIMDLMLRRAAR
ncbi:hypothetical protein [Nesterenkonia halobia]|uniref:ATP-grasp domain-containing protein n=1 Tax=Nesterenkonia halobia TaxID=37922 RepID=A0ABP6RES6_9MICC